MTSEAFIGAAVRTPIGRYGGALANVRTDDLAALPIAALLECGGLPDAAIIDEVVLGCANQAGEDNRNVARMASLLAGLPAAVPAITLNRLCASGLDAIAHGARSIRSGEANVVIAGGVESMTRAPFVTGKAATAFARSMALEDTTIGWRFVNERMVAAYGVDTMPETAQNVADAFGISRADQDAYALRSQSRVQTAQAAGRFVAEIVPVTVGDRPETIFAIDEHPRDTSMDRLAALRPIVRSDGSVTAGNASGVNDGAAALTLMSAIGASATKSEPRARILGFASAGVEPRLMGIGPVAAIQKLLERLALTIGDFDVIEINEAFAAQVLATTRQLGLADDADHVNPNGGAIALGHPLGMSGARLVMTAVEELHRRGARRALCAMCVGVGQGVALALENIAASR